MRLICHPSVLPVLQHAKYLTTVRVRMQRLMIYNRRSLLSCKSKACSVIIDTVQYFTFSGFKHGNPVNHGHTQVYVTDYQRKKLLDLSQSYHDEVLLGHGMMSSFGWMAGLSMYHSKYHNNIIFFFYSRWIVFSWFWFNCYSPNCSPCWVLLLLLTSLPTKVKAGLVFWGVQVR